MHTLSSNQFDTLLSDALIKPRLKKELKFVASTSNLEYDWSQYELLPIFTKTNDEGVLLVQPNEVLYVVQFEIARRIVDSATGRDRAIICDFCYTWQLGSNAASITFISHATKRRVRFLCCGDLACSDHVRSKTKAAKMSRAQLREHLSDEDRIVRLQSRLEAYIEQLELHPVATYVSGRTASSPKVKG